MPSAARPEPLQDRPAVGWDAIGAENQALIMDHYRNPRRRAPLDAPDVEAREVNPFCGDECAFRARLAGGVLTAVSTDGAGCSICQASLSLMAEAVEGRTLAGALALASRFRRMMRGEPLDAAEQADLGALQGLAAVRSYPVRIKCALLAWLALEQALRPHAPA